MIWIGPRMICSQDSATYISFLCPYPWYSIEFMSQLRRRLNTTMLFWYLVILYFSKDKRKTDTKLRSLFVLKCWGDRRGSHQNAVNDEFQYFVSFWVAMEYAETYLQRSHSPQLYVCHSLIELQLFPPFKYSFPNRCRGSRT